MATAVRHPGVYLSTRALAATIIVKWRASGIYPERLLPLRHRERPLLVELVYGTVRRERALRWVLNTAICRQPDPTTLALLSIGVYQITYMDRIPPHAIVAQTVASARELGLDARRTGFVNAVLRRLLQKRSALPQMLAATPLAIRESHPDILIERWEQRFGSAATEALARWNNIPAPLSIRINPLRTTLEALRRRLAANGINVSESANPTYPHAFLTIPTGIRIEAIPGYREGLFLVQDPATDAAIALLEAHPEHCILDACAAPGGKTIALAANLGDHARIWALDASLTRVDRLRDNLARCRISCVQAIHGRGDDPDVLPPVLQNTRFDRILVDAPCTNTGVLRRRPDARWRFSEAALNEVCRLQLKLLDTVAGRLCPGGRLVYGTCSLEWEENEAQVERFLSAHPDFHLHESRFLLPPAGGTDGAYAAALDKRT